MSNWWNWCLMALLVIGLAGRAKAQVAAPKSYSDYYVNSINQGVPAAAAKNPALYTYNLYFYRNPAISPYSNLLRASPRGKTSYSAYVRPEEQRRAQASPQADYLREKKAPSQQRSSPAPGAYHNHWYGGRAQLGLR